MLRWKLYASLPSAHEAYVGLVDFFPSSFSSYFVRTLLFTLKGFGIKV